MAISQEMLQSKAVEYWSLSESVQGASMENFSAIATRSAFLCHSHADEKLVRGLIVIFQKQGIDLYVDWKDHTMPDKPNSTTAKKIQDKIKRTDLFLFLATENSKKSRWCPWEIGYADSSQKNIYIIPTTDGNVEYGNEYLGLYSKIDTSNYQVRHDNKLYRTRPTSLMKEEITTSMML